MLANISHCGIHCSTGGQKCLIGELVWLQDGSGLVLACLVCFLLGRQATCGARYIRVLPTCHDGPECPYDDHKYPNNLIRKEDDKPFTDSLEANDIASTTEFDKKRIEALKAFAYVGKDGFYVGKWNWTASVSHQHRRLCHC